MGRLLLIAARNLLEHRRRSLMLGGGIAFVCVVLVLLVSTSSGMKETLVRTATTLMTGHVNVGGFYKVTAADSAPLITRYRELEEMIRREVPEVDYTLDRVRGWGKIISDTGSLYASVDGVDIAREKGFAKVLQVVAGDVADLGQPATALIFERQAERLEVVVGDMLTISAPTFGGVNNSADVRVVAIARDVGLMSSWMTYVPSDTVRQLYQLSGSTTGVLMTFLHDRDDADEVAVRLRESIAAAGWTIMEPEDKPFWMKFQQVNREDWTGQRIDVTTWEEEISMFRQLIDSFDLISSILVLVLVIIIIVGIMNTLWMAIRERTGEIGTLRAIGMPRYRILVMFLLEAFLLSAVAASVGAAIGVAVALGLNAAEIAVPDRAVQLFLMSDRLALNIDAAAIGRALATIVTMTTLGALYPAWRAARLPPLTAIRHMG